jgi:CubicO group peptidase (beta-lactamase class C family)
MPWMAGSTVVEPADLRLRTALDTAFAEPAHGPLHGTKAIVVVSHGRIVAERYAPGYGIDTPLHGWSLTKSVFNALVGILVREGRLSIDGPAPVAAWRTPGDPRGAITVDQLMRHTAGLDLEQTGSGFDPAARLVFLERDMAGFGERAALTSPVGRVWSYSDGYYAILARIVHDTVGGTVPDVLGFVHRELFDPLGMRDVTLELDATGTPVGGSFMLAPARAWARFGVLYTNDGVVSGRRILPAGWVSHAASPTLDTPYAAGFWRGRAAWRERWNVPADGFFGSGSLGQRLVVIPSEQLVIVRLGVTQVRPDFDAEGLGRLIADVRDALR